MRDSTARCQRGSACPAAVSASGSAMSHALRLAFRYAVPWAIPGKKSQATETSRIRISSGPAQNCAALTQRGPPVRSVARRLSECGSAGQGAFHLIHAGESLLSRSSAACRNKRATLFELTPRSRISRIARANVRSLSPVWEARLSKSSFN